MNSYIIYDVTLDPFRGGYHYSILGDDGSDLIEGNTPKAVAEDVSGLKLRAIKASDLGGLDSDSFIIGVRQGWYDDDAQSFMSVRGIKYYTTV